MPDTREKYEVKDTPTRVAPGKTSGIKSFQTFLWNKENSAFCGRTCSSWGKIILFYVILYGVLGGFWYGQMSVFFLTLNADFPNLKYLDGSVMLNAPGLGYTPTAGIDFMAKETPILRYDMTDPSSYAEYVSSIDTLLDGYTSSNTVYVSDSCASNTGVDTACDVTRSNLAACDGTDPSYGFATGEPCVFFQVNKIIGWEPVADDSSPDATNIGGRWNPGSIPLYCREKSTVLDPTDNTGAGTPDYHPGAGIPMGCFPYCGPSVNFTQGIAAVKFTGISKDRVVRIVCEMYAANVATSEKEKTGAAVFAFHIDSV